MWRRRGRRSPIHIHAFGAATGLTSTVVRRQGLVTSHRQLQSGAKGRQLSHFTRFWFWKDSLLFKWIAIYMKRPQESWFSPVALDFLSQRKRAASPKSGSCSRNYFCKEYSKAELCGKEQGQWMLKQKLYSFIVRAAKQMSSFLLLKITFSKQSVQTRFLSAVIGNAFPEGIIAGSLYLTPAHFVEFVPLCAAWSIIFVPNYSTKPV